MRSRHGNIHVIEKRATRDQERYRINNRELYDYATSTTLADWRFHQVLLHRREMANGLARLKPEQRDLFEAIGLSVPTASRL